MLPWAPAAPAWPLCDSVAAPAWPLMLPDWLCEPIADELPLVLGLVLLSGCVLWAPVSGVVEGCVLWAPASGVVELWPLALPAWLALL